MEETSFDEETNQVKNTLKLYYNLDNSKSLFDNEYQFVIVPNELGKFVNKLLKTYPSFIKISDLCKECENEYEHVSTHYILCIN